MAQWPEQVEINEVGLQRYLDTLQNAYEDIIAQLQNATNLGVQNRKIILAQIDKILSQAGREIGPQFKAELAKFYTTGASQAVEQLKEIGADIPVATGFTVLHKDAIAALVSDAASSFAESIRTAQRSVGRLLTAEVKQQLTQDIATGLTQGAALRDIKNNLVGTLKNDGITGLVDKAGKNWSLDDYAEMLYRTKSTESRNLGFVNRMVENGYDLVQVSEHGATDVCADWEGRILSVTGATATFNGDDVPTLEEATDDGLFHPNCRHAVNAIVPELAAEAYGFTGQYDENNNPIYAKGYNLSQAKAAANDTAANQRIAERAAVRARKSK